MVWSCDIEKNMSNSIQSLSLRERASMYQHHCCAVSFEMRSRTGSGTIAPASMNTVIISDS